VNLLFFAHVYIGLHGGVLPSSEDEKTVDRVWTIIVERAPNNNAIGRLREEGPADRLVSVRFVRIVRPPNRRDCRLKGLAFPILIALAKVKA
jgi:hypothetical protein